MQTKSCIRRGNEAPSQNIVGWSELLDAVWIVKTAKHQGEFYEIDVKGMRNLTQKTGIH